MASPPAKEDKMKGAGSPISVKLSPPKLSKRVDPTMGKDPVKASHFDDDLEWVIDKRTHKDVHGGKPPPPKVISPDMHKRVQLSAPPDPRSPPAPYLQPVSPKQLGEKAARREREEKERNFCKWESLNVPRPVDAETIGKGLFSPSPETSAAKVRPKRPEESVTEGMPDPPDSAELLTRKPKSGIFINTKRRVTDKDKDSFDLVYERRPRPRRAEEDDEIETKVVKDEPPPLVEEEERELDVHCRDSFEEFLGEDEDVCDVTLTKMFRRKVSQCTVATSVNSKELDEFPVFDEADLEEEPHMNKIVQKFRRDSEAQRYKPPPRKITRGTLESHSFTEAEQPTLKDFFYGITLGTINQYDSHFPASARGLQGMCMPVAAYCYATLLHPNKWTELVIDDILEIGTRLYADSVATLHMHNQAKELQFFELHKYCFIETKKIRFQVFQPEVVGQVRSTNRRIFNMYKGLQIFFNRQSAGIIKSCGLDVVVWRDKHYYIFDAKGRRKDLRADPTGPAVLAHVYDIPDLCTILLNYTDLSNHPFTISKVTVSKVMDKDEPEEDVRYEMIHDRSDFNIINEHKAVVRGSFDLADLCFDFARNKQAVAMAVVCLAYSRISPPSSWHTKTVDKIMIIGNQLYLELVESEDVVEMELEHVPAMFTVGPYMVDLLIYSNVYADVMARKGASMLQRCLEKFFASNSMAIVFISRYTLAIWAQRNMFYCFDPYSRNGEGLKCRNGFACVSMHANIESLATTCGTNFDNADDIFHIHALKVLKVHRDPAQAHLFPKGIAMDDYSPDSFKECKVKKSKKKAARKQVTADFSEGAVRPLAPWAHLDPSIIEVGSAVDSLTPEQLPPMVHKFPSKVRVEHAVLKKPIDLDSPSLSDTQIEPERAEPEKDEGELDLTSWILTQEELEMEGYGEGEGDEVEDRGESAAEEYMAMDQYAQVNRGSLGADRMSAQVNTDITVGFLPVPRDLLSPTNIRWKQRMLKEREVARRRQILIMEEAVGQPILTQSMELAKESNFVDLPDGSQIIRGTCNIAGLGEDVEYMAPFVCMMSAAVAQKYALGTWSKEIVDYALGSGAKLYGLSKVRYDQVPILDVPKVSLGQSNFSILAEYLTDNVFKQRVLEETLVRLLFRKHECGLIATPSYACAVFYKNQLFYLFDCFGCNEVGLGEGPKNSGTACLARFKTVQDLARRILHNKTKRDKEEEYDFSRFVLSSCTAKPIPPKLMKFGAGEDGEDQEIEVEEDHPLRENKVGYQLSEGMLTLQGSTALHGRATNEFYNLKPDHFVCICASLMLLNYPILRWDTKRVNYVVEQGNHVYSHAENFSISDKRIIRNILIYQHFFDIIITTLKFPDWHDKKNLSTCLDHVMRKRDYILMQFPNCCYVIYKHTSYFHVFDPYPCLQNGAADPSEAGFAGWTIFNTLDEVKERIKNQIVPDGNHFIFYTFEVTSVSKAPKSLIIGQKLMDYELDQKTKPEKIAASFNERDIWLLREPIPWSRVNSYTARNVPRGRADEMWNNWDVEYANDLYSIAGTIHQSTERFGDEVRGKQTLACLVVAIAMTEIYPLAEWTAAIIDSTVVFGSGYFVECVASIDEEDHEFDTDDLQPSCLISPYRFELVIVPVVHGTMFIMRANQFNLFKALRFFFAGHKIRKGIVCCDKGVAEKRFVAFGKMQEHEYFMYDCEINGPPMFVEHRGASYVLRCKTLKRLLYVMTLTLRGGDFFIFEVDVGSFRPVE
ncbi:hypothetical protein PPYR_03216 [Photinus pyralis]|uniref:Uncharacterized protein n=6 Tax=Photinus pyralis TaxID=7054 RepID=A0A5N4A292_PHOPY|nr:uncharacterized protein LOC116161655 [Photinus pyralis]KAB0791416.1 hypothetical protein PPYR_03216 [Photinus pyralis]